jgi:NhaA family Na+:H+ antiporter
MPINAFREFLRLEGAAGLILVGVAAFAILCANSGLAPYYDALLEVPVEVRVGSLSLAKPILLWINDGLMAVFFLLVGLEFKREVMVGELSGRGQIALPVAAAIGGMAIPAAIYAAFNLGDAVALRGWAIPAATDIAFTLAVLSLLGSRVPPALKVFLAAVAIIDDIGAVVVIAAFYTAGLSWISLLLAGIAAAVLLALNLAGVARRAPYIVVGVILWVCVLKSGIHATLAGVVVGLAVPLRHGGDPEDSPLRQLEHALHPWVAFLIVPLFGFANAGVSFAGVAPSALLAGIPLGIAAGLVVGKQVGILLGAALLVRTGLARLPEAVGWRVLWGGAILCGIGFTMSLFIGALAFEGARPPAGGLDYAAATRIGVLAGSLASAALGALVIVGARR